MSTTRRQKNLTVMFTDISGFTKHTETISREDLMSRLDTHNDLLMPIIAHFEGEIVKTIGDAFLITFESPTNGVQCGLFMQHTLRKYNADKPEGKQIHIKVSINSGEVTVTDNDVFGDPVNVAAKIEKATNPDEIYFTESVFLAMNKAEVPTSFVKSFRPKGAESSEIKLYRVAMDEDDARYQKIVSGTNIDANENKTKVIELSNTAEKEFMRYQDTLDALVESQGKSSRGLVVGIIASALILGAAIIIGFIAFGGSSKTAPGEQLAEDVRTYLQTDKPAEARGRIESYIDEHGADDTTSELVNEIKTYEIQQVVGEADALIADGRPEDARSAIKKYFGADDLPDNAAGALMKSESYLAARQAIEDGDAEQASKTIKKAFGDTNPSAELKSLRDQAEALVTARGYFEGPERYSEPLLLIGAISKVFGDDTRNKHALKYMEEGLANEMYRFAKDNGADAAQKQYETYRQQFSGISSWSWIQSHMAMGGIWHFRMNNRSGWRHNETGYWRPWRKVQDEVSGNPERAYRFGCFNYMMSRNQWLATLDGVVFWKEATDADKSLMNRHANLCELYRPTLSGDAKNLGYDLKTDVMYVLGYGYGSAKALHSLVKDYFYKDVRDRLVAFANTEDPNLRGEQVNALAILIDMGEAGVIQDPFGVFRDQFDDMMKFSATLTRHHRQAIFQLEISYDDYKEFRRVIDKNLEDVTNKVGPYANYTHARERLQEMQTDLRAAQPIHTEQFEQGG